MNKSNDTKKKLLVGMGTYNRPKMLAKTLEALCAVDIPGDVEANLLVVDSEESAAEVFSSFEAKLPFKTHYIGNQPRGIVMMRNGVLEKALELDVDLVGFMDDDILVSPDWISRSLALMETYNADVIDGAVKRTLPEGTPGWVSRGGFFRWHSAPTGSVRQSGSTSNIFFKIKLIKEWGLRFDPFFNFSGGEDTFFFSQAHKKGAKIVWNNEVLVTEQIGDAKITTQWILQRAYRRTNAKFYRRSKEIGYRKAAFLYSFNAVFLLLIGTLLLLLTFFLGPIAWIHSLRFIKKGIGYFQGIFGNLYEEYREVVGD